MRRALLVGDDVDTSAIIGARRSTTTAIVVSGIRCTIAYLLIPIFAPFVGLVDTVGDPVSVILSSFAIVMAVVGMRRFWIADHRARWAYTTFIAAVVVLLSVAIVIDVSAIVSS